MSDTVGSEQDGSLSVRRVVALALVGVLVMSGVVGMIGGSGIVAAQANGSAGNTTAGNTSAAGANATSNSTDDPVNATIQEFKRQNLGYANLSDSKKQEIRSDLQELNSGDLSQLEQNRKIGNIQSILNSGGAMGPNEFTKPKNIIENQLSASNASSEVTTDGDPTDGPLLSKIDSLTDRQLKRLGDSFKTGAADSLGTVYNLSFSTPVPENDGWNGIFGEPINGTNTTNGTNGTNATNATVSGQADDSWRRVLGISSDKSYRQLHEQLLMDRLYPLLNYILGIGVVVLGLSLTVNPFMSRFRVIDLMTKFVTFLFLYAFSWGTITLMHGVVNDITMWLRPSSAEFKSLVTSIDKLAVGAAAASFVGSGGILSSVLGMGVELAVRHLALVYFFPYVFPVLVLILYLAPWQRAKQFASMGLWQYVNVLTMVIPMAVFLKAALIVDINPTNGIGGMIVLLALFGLAVIVPIIQTYFFIQIPGTAAWAAKSAGAAAASRLGIGGDDADDSGSSSADTTATGNTSPGDRAEAAIEASSESRSGLSESGSLDSSPDIEKIAGSNPETTAAKVRELDKNQHSDPNSADAKYEAYLSEEQQDGSGPHRTTMQSKLAD
ncbi:hypothetical protein [Halococcus salifodinae]|uniref:Uncharacterized protein n=2 Tax=Halococcus salifodinae TaxID=36738 RepID=M0MTK9_9EURY|nr:hypothetical protein C450_20866 [Halococcus salifodinae DSM 8989]